MVNGNDADKINSLFYQGLAEQGIVLADESVNRLVRYSLELIKWNRKVNLVAKNTSVEDIVEKHFLDSLTLLPVLEGYSGRQASLLDVGSGAGFPGLVIKSVSPERPVTLLEPRHRRVSFLNHIIRTLQLKGIEVSSMRTDELATTSHPPYEVITGRAVADVTAFLDMVKDLAEPDTLVVCMQGASGPEQWEKEQVNKQYSRIAIERTSLPFSQAKRSILVFRTIAAASKLR